MMGTEPGNARILAALFVGLALTGAVGFAALLRYGAWLAVLAAATGAVLITLYIVRTSGFYCARCDASYDLASLRASGADTRDSQAADDGSRRP